MRLRAIPAVSVACLLGLMPRLAPAADDANGPSASAEATSEARRHFKLGIKLYQDTNYSGALAEFEAAYAAKPGPGSLQNVALCQKALFRYREAAATLEELLRTHSSELSEGETKAVTEAITELHGLVGSIVVNVEPSDAKVSIDGRAVPLSELRTGVDLNVGEHTLVADFPGYARLSRVVTVAAGQKQLPIELKLRATDGFLNVLSSDPRAAIAIDGTTRAFHEWRGSVKPDTDHLIQVFREGYEGFETNVSVALGKTVDVRAELGPHIGDETPDVPLAKSGAMPPPPPRRVPRGYYGLLTLGVLGLGQHPLQLTRTRSDGAMGTIGLRAGYRMWAPVAAEFMLDFGKLAVTDAKSDDSPVLRAYTLNALRFVHHRLVLDPAASGTGLTGGSASGFDPYFLLELGAQWSIGHFLLGAEVVTLIDGATSLNKRNIEGATKAFGNTNTLPLFGLAIHGGFGLW